MCDRQPVDLWAERVSGGGAHLHIYRIAYTNEARVSSYIQATLRHEEFFFWVLRTFTKLLTTRNPLNVLHRSEINA